VKGFVVASHFQGHQSTVAVTNEEGRARLSLQREHVLTLFDDAVIVTLRAALASSAALDGVDRKMLGQGARGGSVVGSHGEDAGNHKNRWPASHGKIANLGPILGARCGWHSEGASHSSNRSAQPFQCHFARPEQLELVRSLFGEQVAETATPASPKLRSKNPRVRLPAYKSAQSTPTERQLHQSFGIADAVEELPFR
jgi:hypothetical protein